MTSLSDNEKAMTKEWFKTLVDEQEFQQREASQKSRQKRNNGANYLDREMSNLRGQYINRSLVLINENAQQNNVISQEAQKIEEKKQQENKDKKTYDVFGALMGLSGLFMSIAEFEQYSSNNFQSDWLCYVLRSLISTTTLISVLCIIKKALLEFKIKRDKGLVLTTTNFPKTPEFRLMMFEIIINSVHCPPGIDLTFPVANFQRTINLSVDGCCMCVMLFRVYLLSKVFAHYSKWLDINAQSNAEQENCEVNITFAVKAVLKERPNETMIFMMVISDIVFALAVRHFEMAYYDNKDDYPSSQYQDYSQTINSAWLIMITMMTVGFGDYYPRTHLGRAICIVACFWGVIIVSMMVVTLTNATTLSQKETRAYGILYRLHLKTQIKMEAANVITKFLRLIALVNRNKSGKQKASQYYRQLKLKLHHELVDSMASLRSAFSNLFENELTADEILRQISEQMDRDLHDIKISMDKINQIREYLQEIEGSQDHVLTLVNESAKLSKKLDDVLMSYRFQQLG